MGRKRKVVGALHELAAHLSKLCEGATVTEPESNVRQMEEQLGELEAEVERRRAQLDVSGILLCMSAFDGK